MFYDPVAFAFTARLQENWRTIAAEYVFDDRLEHEVWNDHDEERVVLLVDFVP